MSEGKKDIPKELFTEWERRLAEADPTLLPPERESLFSEEIFVSKMDKTDTAIAMALQKEGEHKRFGGSPSTYEQLCVVACEAAREREGVVGVHTSCVTDTPCVYVACSDGTYYHFNTRHIQNFDSEKFLHSLDREGIKTKESID